MSGTTHAVPQPNFRLRGNHKSRTTRRLLPASISARSDSLTHTDYHDSAISWLSLIPPEKWRIAPEVGGHRSFIHPGKLFIHQTF
jgi:hypothetical protein